MSDKAGKESQFGLTPLFRLGGGWGRDIKSHQSALDVHEQVKNARKVFEKMSK